MRLGLVAAIGRDGTIGVDGGLPWHIPGDLAHFKRVTTGHPVIMGRTTFESIGRALPHRTNIVVTANRHWHAVNVTVAADLGSAITEAARRDSQAFIIGGASVYAHALELVDELIISHVDAAPGGDTRFPEIDWTAWRETARCRHSDSDPPFDIVIYRRAT